MDIFANRFNIIDTETIHILIDLLSCKLRRKLYRLVLNSIAGDEEGLARLLEENAAVLSDWRRPDSKTAPDDRHTAKLLALAFEFCQEINGFLQTELVEKIKKVGASLNSAAQSTINIHQFLSSLDEKSQKIIWRLWRLGHADINELSLATGSANHMEVLMCIRETINPLALAFFKKPALEFFSRRIDDKNGDTINFQWWLNKDLFEFFLSDNLAVDWLENGQEIVFTLAIPEKIDLDRAKIDFKNGLLIIRAPKINFKF